MNTNLKTQWAYLAYTNTTCMDVGFYHSILNPSRLGSVYRYTLSQIKKDCYDVQDELHLPIPLNAAQLYFGEIYLGSKSEDEN